MSAAKTKTGQFPIGFRRGWGDWTRPLEPLADFARAEGFAFIDLMNFAPEQMKVLKDRGLSIGSVDLLDFGNLLSKDPAVRSRLVEENVAYVRKLAPVGVRYFFTCVIPGDPAKPRAENYSLAVETFAPIAKAVRECGGRIVVEGWPGVAPYYATLCCTPETYRAFIRDLGADAVGVNYDPSHLIRLGVDPLRFLKEFVQCVHHVHAKDTELFPEALYELGTVGESISATPHELGAHTWRYTIPGRGVAPWKDIFATLSQAGYRGGVSVELEDEHFNGSEATEKDGLRRSLAFLASV